VNDATHTPAPFRLAMGKHLPPSAAALRLVDAGGGAGAALTALRDDLAVEAVDGAIALAGVPTASADAVTWLGPLDETLLRAAWRALRPGGRFIAVDPAGQPGPEAVTALTAAGFVRVLVEAAVLDPSPAGALMRGERPHTTGDTLARVEGVAARDAGLTDWSAFRGRYVHLLVRVTPDKPAWKLEPGEPVQWHAAAVQREAEPALLAFSSLPNAVAFLQQAVLAGTIEGVNKVAKFPRAAAERWAEPLIFNPTLAALNGCSLLRLPVNPVDAVTGEE
jgi:SAM-dependent methyltransferase